MSEFAESSSAEVTELWGIYDINRVKTGHTVDRGTITEEIAYEMIARGEFHLIVYVWYKNPRDEFLISKRSLKKEFGNLWEPTGGSAWVHGYLIFSAPLSYTWAFYFSSRRR